MFFEEPGQSVTSKTMVAVGGPYSVKGLMTNPISSPEYWKPSTFGGDVGFNIVKTTSLKKLFCQNMKFNDCENIGFVVKQFPPQKDEL